MSVSKKGARENLLKQFNDEELLTFFRWANEEYNWPSVAPESVRCQLERVIPVNLFIKALGHFCFGKEAGDRSWREVYDRILNALPECKEKFSASHPALPREVAQSLQEKTGATSESFSWVGYDLVAWNEHVGEVLITHHALERFYQRSKNVSTPISTAFKNPEHLLEQFKKAFARAKPTEIDPAHRVKRIINNDFKPAVYLFDREANFRFVLPEQKRGKKLIISTVERPR